MPTFKTISGMHIGAYANSGPRWGIISKGPMFNPRHRSVHQHIGELYLVLHEPMKAEEHRAALELICLVPCEELGDLVRVIAAYKSSAAR